MTTYGVTPNGFVIKRLPVIEDEIKTELKSASKFGEGVNVEADSVLGQIIGILAEREALLWEGLQASYDALYPASAEGAALDNVVDLIGMTRLSATYSEVEVTCYGVPATVIPIGTIFSVINTGERFATLTEVIIGGGGEIDVECRAENTGLVRANTGTLTERETPIIGLTAVSNAEDATLGTEIETDAELRLRRLISLRLIGGGTVDSIRAVILQDIDEAEDCIVIENDSDVTDSEGRPPHSIHVIVKGGDDTEIAELIWVKKGCGIATHGSTTISVQDSMSFSHDINFDRPTKTDIWIHVEITVDSDFNQGAQQVETVTVDTVTNSYSYIVIVDGVEFTYESSGAATAQEIAEGLKDVVNAGIEGNHVNVTATWAGGDFFTLTADYAGCSFIVTLTDPTKLIQTELTANTGDQAAIKAAIVDYADKVQVIGEDVITSRYYVPVNDVNSDVLSITVKVGKIPPPTSSANIVIASAEIAIIDGPHVTIEIV